MIHAMAIGKLYFAVVAGVVQALVVMFRPKAVLVPIPLLAVAVVAVVQMDVITVEVVVQTLAVIFGCQLAVRKRPLLVVAVVARVKNGIIFRRQALVQALAAAH